MRKFFEEPTLVVSEFAVVDVISTSGDPEGSGNESGSMNGGFA